MKYAFTHGKLLDGTKDMQVQEGLCVLTDGERISAIVPEGTPLDGYTVVDLQGRYLMPGLINMHVHLAASRPSARSAVLPILTRGCAMRSRRAAA